GGWKGEGGAGGGGKVVAGVEQRDVEEAHVAEPCRPHRGRYCRRDRQQRELRGRPWPVFWEWHGHTERQGVPLPWHPLELGGVGILHPQLKNARYRRVGLLDEIGLRRDGRLVVRGHGPDGQHEQRDRHHSATSGQIPAARRRPRPWRRGLTLDHRACPCWRSRAEQRPWP